MPTKKEIIRALLAERDYCATQGKDRRVSEINDELDNLGYDENADRKTRAKAVKAAEKQAEKNAPLETTDGESAPENTVAPKVEK